MAVSPSPDKFVYITGCDTGFGNILSKDLDKKGFGVIAGVYLESSVATLKAQCSKNLHAIQVDVSNDASVAKAGKQIGDILRQTGGVLHGVVNNAGILVQPGLAEWTTNDAYRKMFNVNVMGTVMTTKSVMPYLRKSQGRIVNVASIAGRVGLPTQPAYCMTKYGVEGYSEVLRKECYGWGISVHIIEPGIFKATGLYDTFSSGYEEMWAGLEPEVKKAYGEEFFRGLKKGAEEAVHKGSSKSELVPQAMAHALTDAKPKYRYRVGNDSIYAVTLVEKLHESWQDSILAQLWTAQGQLGYAAAAKDAKLVAYNRYHKAWGRFAILVALLLVAAYRMRSR